MAQIPQPANITFTIGDSSPFGERSPKADGIKAVKLTEGNVRELAAYLIKTLGGAVEISDFAPHGLKVTREGDLAPIYLTMGRWIVEEYDYRHDRVTFRQAEASERQKYDLR